VQYVLGQPLRTGAVVQAGIEHVFDGGIAPAHHVADHHAVGCRLQMRRFVAFVEFDAQRPQLLAHRRIDGLIGAGDAMARGLRQGGDSSHEGAANAENVDVHSSSRRRFCAIVTVLLADQDRLWIMAYLHEEPA